MPSQLRKSGLVYEQGFQALALCKKCSRCPRRPPADDDQIIDVICHITRKGDLSSSIPENGRPNPGVRNVIKINPPHPHQPEEPESTKSERCVVCSLQGP